MCAVNSSNLLFLMVMSCVLCETGTESIYIIQLKFGFQKVNEENHDQFYTHGACQIKVKGTEFFVRGGDIEDN